MPNFAQLLRGSMSNAPAPTQYGGLPFDPGNLPSNYLPPSTDLSQFAPQEMIQQLPLPQAGITGLIGGGGAVAGSYLPAVPSLWERAGINPADFRLRQHPLQPSAFPQPNFLIPKLKGGR